jgi:hypothetical protein
MFGGCYGAALEYLNVWLPRCPENVLIRCLEAEVMVPLIFI